MRRRPAFLTLLVIPFAFACAEHSPDVGEWHEEAGYRWRELDVAEGATDAASARSGFTALPSSRTGVTHRNDVPDASAMANRNLLIGAGAAVGDVDGDGLPDLFLASVARPAVLYRNLGGFRFADVTASSGLALDGLASTGAVLADVDGDGDLDLLVGTHGGPIKLFSNDGAGSFSDATGSSGLIGGYAATTFTLADVDRDGDLDLYVATYKVRSALDAFPPQARAFDQVVTKTATGYAVRPEWVKEYRIDDRPDLGGIVRSQRGDPDLFFLNDGTGHFVHTPIAGARFSDSNGRPLTAEPDFFTLAARFYDVNGDGAPDIYVCNDFEDPDQFWINNGSGDFRLAPTHALSATSNTCMSVDFADVDRDGTVDIFTADMLSPTLAKQQSGIPTHTPLPKPIGESAERPQWMRNMLHVGRGDGSWAEVAEYAGVAATDWTWGSAFLDVDLDGFEDLLTVNGHRWDIRDADTFDRIRNSFPRVAWDKEQGEFPLLATRSIALRNNGDLTFRPMSDGWGIGETDAISQGIALADFDLDGDLDVVVTRLNAPAQIFRNEATAPRIAVRLNGPSANRSGVGANIRVLSAGLAEQAKEVSSGGHYLSGSEAQLVFAVNADSVTDLVVDWPDQRRSLITGVRANRLYEVRADAAQPRSVAAVASPLLPTGGVLFEDATSLLGGHTHHETLYDDFRRQPLLPNRFSQLGPGLAWVDADGDGRDDLVVGAGRGGMLALLLNGGARFTQWRLAGPARGDLTAIVPFADGRGGLRVAVGQSNYEAGSLDSALDMPSVLGVSLRVGTPTTGSPIAGADTASVGALASGDVNGDGWLDLFVAPRVIGGAWPVPAPSRLLLGRPDGSFGPDSVNRRALSALGLVSAALMADLDGNGTPELIVAGEFGPVRVLRNESGIFRDVTADLGLSDLRSRWNGLTVGDFDGDGRLDLVATSWGRNVSWKATVGRPHVLLTGTFGSSALGLVFSRSDSVTRREMPLESFARLGLAFPGLRTRVATYEEFSQQSVSELFGSSASDAVRVGATTYDHTLLLNRGDRFEIRSLPAAAQLAPAFGASVADFDGDGNDDLFLAQNFHPTEIATMRFTAGVGLVLLGDGTGGFRSLSVRESGIVVRGDQRGSGVADFDRDGRADLAVSQNGGLTTLWRNATGAPGIRVRLEAGEGNPAGVGAVVRVQGDGWFGPVRAISSGSGYWSADSPTIVLGQPNRGREIWVRWPSGREERHPYVSGTRSVVLREGAGFEI